MSGNLPDGCIWPSDLDYYEWLNPTRREDDDSYRPEYEDEYQEEEQ